MNVEITGRHVVITSAIRSFVMKRLRKFDKLCGDDANIHVIIDVEKERHTAEILLKSKILDLTGKGETADMYASIGRAIEKLERQAIKNKTRMIESKRQKAKTRSVQARSGIRRPRVPSKVDQDLDILEEALPRKPLAVEEAAAALDQSEYQFVAFKNVESGSMNILYRRKDGSLCLIQD